MRACLWGNKISAPHLRDNLLSAALSDFGIWIAAFGIATISFFFYELHFMKYSERRRKACVRVCVSARACVCVNACGGDERSGEERRGKDQER